MIVIKGLLKKNFLSFRTKPIFWKVKISNIPYNFLWLSSYSSFFFALCFFPFAKYFRCHSSASIKGRNSQTSSLWILRALSLLSRDDVRRNLRGFLKQSTNFCEISSWNILPQKLPSAVVHTIAIYWVFSTSVELCVSARIAIHCGYDY